jgi:hypothetical protein
MRFDPLCERYIVCVTTLLPKIEHAGNGALQNDTCKQDVGEPRPGHSHNGIHQKEEDERRIVPVIVGNVEEDIKRQQAAKKWQQNAIHQSVTLRVHPEDDKHQSEGQYVDCRVEYLKDEVYVEKGTRPPSP